MDQRNYNDDDDNDDEIEGVRPSIYLYRVNVSSKTEDAARRVSMPRKPREYMYVSVCLCVEGVCENEGRGEGHGEGYRPFAGW